MIPIKNAKEIEKMRQACRTASDILDRVSDLVRPGITTKEVDEAAADFMSDAHVKSAFLGYRLGHRVFPGTFAFRSMTKWCTASAANGGFNMATL